MLDTLMNQNLTFPMYVWSSPCDIKCATTNSVDISYSGSRIDRTYFTFRDMAQAEAGQNKSWAMAQEKPIESGGVWPFSDIKWVHIDIQGIKYPGSDGLTGADPAVFKSYTEFLEGGSVGVDL